ncbi:MAG: AAA family ATPase [Candidatus Bathyarchaeota archaeon]|nr:AAA family ATPase [Candidatus Bathyarchaeota archaeon]
MKSKTCSVVAFVSGKGGVGKTLLSVNLANLTATSGLKTVLLDCDLLNRGATALLQPSIKDNSTLKNLVLEKYKDINLVEIGKVLFLPSSATGQILNLKELPVDYLTWKAILQEIINEIIEKYGPQVIIIDSEAGPHALSIGIAGIADKTVIVSEADPVTWDGTLNFRSYLQNAYGNEKQFYFLLNKIPKKFNFGNLDDYYENKIGGLLKNLKIMAFIPFEYQIFESFGEVMFVTDEFPKSVFSQKLKLLAYDLLKDKADLFKEEVKSENLRILDFDEGEIKFINRRLRPATSKKSMMYQALGIIMLITGIFAVLFGTNPQVLFENPIITLGYSYAIIGIIIIAYSFFRRR